MVISRAALAAFTCVLALFCAFASDASASRIRECGNWGVHKNGHFGWGMSAIQGAGIFNVTTRKVRCRKARHFVRHYRSTDSYYPTWNCREHNSYEFSDIRCTASRGRVIHWQAGA